MIHRVRTWGWRDWAWVVAAGLLAIVVGWIIHALQVQAAQVAALAEALSAEQSAVEQRGERPVAPNPDELLADPRFKGPRGPRGRSVVSVMCVNGRWEVTYSDRVVADAGDCTGDQGPRGVAGSPGADGKSGADGQPGQPGKDGEDGKDGRGIQSAKCVENNGEWRWQVTYTDGVVDDNAGPCYQPRRTEPSVG